MNYFRTYYDFILIDFFANTQSKFFYGNWKFKANLIENIYKRLEVGGKRYDKKTRTISALVINILSAIFFVTF